MRKTTTRGREHGGVRRPVRLPPRCSIGSGGTGGSGRMSLHRLKFEQASKSRTLSGLRRLRSLMPILIFCLCHRGAHSETRDSSKVLRGRSSVRVRHTFKTHSTKNELHLEICNQCHPFFTGRQKLIDTEGRVERFTKRFGAQSVEGRKAADRRPTRSPRRTRPRRRARARSRVRRPRAGGPRQSAASQFRRTAARSSFCLQFAIDAIEPVGDLLPESAGGVSA